jgi:hypothetical protein
LEPGVSAETLKVVMRHRDFATTEEVYGAIRSAEAAAMELTQVLEAGCRNRALLGGISREFPPTAQLNKKELAKLKALLASL